MKNAYVDRSVHLGGVDQFQMGAFTWADGWLMTFTLTSASWGLNFPRLNYGQSGVDNRVSLSRYTCFKNGDIANVARRLICREVAGRYSYSRRRPNATPHKQAAPPAS